ncbi:hypothetical protein OIDMADRAFT_51101 [Oidiodendron maius Zn]|uniref:NACHT domain-containing protein n=1 Tax=Oidiodendron maius (strain Zn) TaxID=913774 RepID=A0A0C3HQJ5_OIDMZ|nr:hypothetical protein OIDMADRAFT_51101 [Oidiodendron maius Zn]
MRLLRRRRAGSFELTDYLVDNIPKYAVLSHTWLADDEEVSFEDLVKGNAQHKASGFHKIQFCGEQAAKDGLEYIWVDTCCIDKSSSAELQESIITDVSVPEDRLINHVASSSWESAFRSSRWFTRGWTLQELIAPSSVSFFSVQGTRLGDKKSLEHYIHEITRIPTQALRGDSLIKFSIAERLSWSENRKTRRKEDKAYSLLGIFDIFMPLMYGEGDYAFARLREEIDKKYTESARLDHLLSKLPIAPQAAFNSFDNQHGETCLPDTRVELLQDITEWVDGQDKRCIFWLNGMAGTGKSTVARTIARKYHDQGNLGASFFFSRRGGDVGPADKLFTTLASQLANKIPSARRYIREAILEHPEIAAHSLRDQWDQLLFNPLSKLDGISSRETIVLVIDALDECDSDRDIRIILRLLATTSSLTNIRLRIFITSRPEIAVRYGFSQIAEAERQVFILHDILPKIVDRDLTLFFEHNFKIIREERGFAINWPRTRIIRRLVEISCGLFIWASTACRFIREGRRLADKRISLLINDYRSGAGPEKQLDEIYITVLKDSIQQGYTEEEKKELLDILRDVLGSIVTLFTPLSVKSLAHLLNIPPSHITETLADLHTIFHIPDQTDRPIRPHHPTFHDFLLDKDRCSDLDFWVDENHVHKALGDNCIRLMSKMLKENICGLQSPGTLVKDVDPNLIEQCIPPELQYACLYWIQHYRQSGTRLYDGDPVHRFFQQHFLHWLEAVNLMGKGSQMGALIRMYHSLLGHAENLRQRPFVKGARRFNWAFQSIIEQAPLQTYCLALTFIRPTKERRHHLWSQIQPWSKGLQISEATAPKFKDEDNYVNDVAFTPDGRQVASGSVNEVVRVWDVATKATIGKFEGQLNKVSSVAISPDGTMIASGSDDTTIMVWEWKSRALRYTLRGHSRWVNSVVFSLDGKMLASGSMDETVRIWDVEKGQELSIFDGNSSCVNSVAFSPDASLLATGSTDQIVRLWDVVKGELRMLLDGHAGAINSVQFSPNGRRIISGADDMTIKLWDAITGTEYMTLKGHRKRVMTVAFSPNAHLIASGSEDMTIKLWEANTGNLLKTLKGHISGINAVTFSPDGELLVSGSFNDDLRLWDAKSGEARGEFDEFEEDAMPTSDKKTKTLDHESTVVAAGELKENSGTATCVVFSSDGQLVASSSDDTTIKLWTGEGAERWLLDGHSGSINCLAFSPDTRLVASASTDKEVKVWYTETGVVWHTLQGHSDNVCCIQFSPDGHFLASCSADKTAVIWHVRTGVIWSRLVGHSDRVNGIAFSPDNRFVASCSADTTVRLWDISTKVVSRALRGHSETVNSVAFSSDGKLLISCSADASIKLWNTAGAACGTLKGHTLPVNCAAFSPDNKMVVSCSDDATVRLWDSEIKSLQGVLKFAVAIRTVCFSSCGRYIETNKGVLDIGLFALASPLITLDRLFILHIIKHEIKNEEEDIF